MHVLLLLEDGVILPITSHGPSSERPRFGDRSGVIRLGLFVWVHEYDTVYNLVHIQCNPSIYSAKNNCVSDAANASYARIGELR